MRIAAVGDLHVNPFRRGALGNLFKRISQEADVLVLCGDLTTFGTVSEAQFLADDLSACAIPAIGVLGNHDHHANRAPEVAEIVGRAGLRLLDGGACVIDGVGFAGCKGAAGGFGRERLRPFGECEVKAFVRAATEENMKLEKALQGLAAAQIVVVTHYAPVDGTLLGEPAQIHPFLGCGALGETIDRFAQIVCAMHGHAHEGTHMGHTPRGVPVYNVAQPLLRRFLERDFALIDV